jgi:hypothetical protein
MCTIFKAAAQKDPVARQMNDLDRRDSHNVALGARRHNQ